jgi:hypothetical protein
VAKVRDYFEGLSYFKGDSRIQEIIDEKLVREAISNAIMHRDYDAHGTNRVMITNKTIAISSPGRWNGRIWAELIDDNRSTSTPKDDFLSDYLVCLGASEGSGSGFNYFRQYIKEYGIYSLNWKEDGIQKYCTTTVDILRHKSFVNREFQSITEKKINISSSNFKFINRTDELKEFTKANPAAYILISAPTGYGKSILLENIVERLEQMSFCIYIKLEGKSNLNLKQLANLIISECNGNYVDNLSHEQIGLELLKAAQKKNKNEIIICIDDIDSISSTSINDLLNEFIPTIEQQLIKIPHIPIKLRIIFTCCQTMKCLYISSEIILTEIKLKPFDFDSVHQTVKIKNFLSTDMPKVSSDFVKDCAKHLMWFTGGHPGAVDKILNNGDFNGSDEQTYYDTIVKPIICQIRKNHIAPEMLNIFDMLSPIRRFNSNLFQYFIKHHLLNCETGSLETKNEQITNAFSDDEDSSINDSARQLLSIRMRKEHPDQFKKVCQGAIIFFQNKLQSLEYRPELYAIEILFLQLQLLSIAKNKQIGELISKLKEIVQTLKHAPAGQEHMSSFRRYLLKDWELNFFLDYLFPEIKIEGFLKEIS